MIACKICQKIFNSLNGLSIHIKHLHKISSKDYYDKFIKRENEGICLYCKKESSYISLIKGYYHYCSQICSANSLERKEKVKQTCLKKYGVESSNQSKEIKEKIKQTFINKYGVENPMECKEIKEKIKQICLKKYGVENPMECKEIQSRLKNTILLKYGVDNYAKTSQFRQLAREQMISSIMKNYPERSQWCPKKGNYEKEVFDELQKYCKYQLLEDQQFIGYSPDRYIKEINTIVELHEPWHKQKCYTTNDIKRQKDLESLGYNFFIIWLKDWFENKDKIKSDFLQFSNK